MKDEDLMKWMRDKMKEKIKEKKDMMKKDQVKEIWDKCKAILE